MTLYERLKTLLETNGDWTYCSLYSEPDVILIHIKHHECLAPPTLEKTFWDRFKFSKPSPITEPKYHVLWAYPDGRIWFESVTDARICLGECPESYRLIRSMTLDKEVDIAFKIIENLGKPR